MNKQKMRRNKKPNRVAKYNDKKVNRTNLMPNSGKKQHLEAKQAAFGWKGKGSKEQCERYDIEQEKVRAAKVARRIMHQAGNVNLGCLV